MDYKRCRKCGKVKSTRSFRTAKQNKDGTAGTCTDCDKKRDAAGIRIRKRVERYGVDFFQTQLILQSQQHRCPISGVKIDESASLDHEENPFKVRGLLLARCNTGLGQFHHSREELLSAIRYLQRNLSEPEYQI